MTVADDVLKDGMIQRRVYPLLERIVSQEPLSVAVTNAVDIEGALRQTIDGCLKEVREVSNRFYLELIGVYIAIASLDSRLSKLESSPE